MQVEVSGGKTTFILTHRQSTIVDVDRIVVIEDGKTVESGSYDNLQQDKVFSMS